VAGVRGIAFPIIGPKIRQLNKMLETHSAHKISGGIAMMGHGIRFVISLCGDSEGWDGSAEESGLLIRSIEKLQGTIAAIPTHKSPNPFLENFMITTNPQAMMALYYYLAASVWLNYGVTQRALPESVNDCPAMGMNCQS